MNREKSTSKDTGMNSEIEILVEPRVRCPRIVPSGTACLESLHCNVSDYTLPVGKLRIAGLDWKKENTEHELTALTFCSPGLVELGENQDTPK